MKKVSKQKLGNVGNHRAVAIQKLLVEAAPIAEAPKPPSGIVSTVDPKKGARPTRGQLTDAPAAAAELAGSASFAHDFGAHVAPADVLAENLVRSAAWTAAHEAASAWADHVGAGTRAAWGMTLKQLEKFRTAFDLAVADDPEIAKRYRHTVRFLGSRSESALRAAATRAKKRAAKAKAVAATEAIAPTSGPPSPPTVTH